MKHPVNRYLLSAIASFVFFALPTHAFTAPATITYSYQHHLFVLYPAQHPEWKQPKRQWFYRGIPAVPPAELLTCGKEKSENVDWTWQPIDGWNESAIARTIRTDIAAKIDRGAGAVTIASTASGITFQGLGLIGRKVDVDHAAELTKVALEHGVDVVRLPVAETQPMVRVLSPELLQRGIREVVTIGESVFTGSPVNRRHNIGVGVRKFNGHLIPQGSVFSFNEVLGPVNERTGYRKELVIQGDATLPDYGGGLCQVSSTAYRGPWEYGMPIVQRKNHSYTVRYYSPQGTDATIYPPGVDMKFLNNTSGDLLIQTHIDENDRAYFVYYGTRDDRSSEVIGPYVWGTVSAPKEERIVYTTEIPAGEKRKAGERHDGMKVEWFRIINSSGSGQSIENIFSNYEARPLYWQIGVAPGDSRLATSWAESAEPSWIPTSR